MALADIAIALYALESAVMRTSKAIETESEERHALKMLMAQALASDTLLEVEMAARKVMQAASDENKLARNTAAVINELSRLQRSGIDQVKRQIAKHLLSTEHYIC